MVFVYILVGAVLLFAVTRYNRLVRLRTEVNAAWADIDVQLRKRWELVPKLTETVERYASHERGTFAEVSEALSRARGAREPGEAAAAEEALLGAVRSVFVVSEAYPDLQAVASFTQLQSALADVEEGIQNARRYYNATVREYNTLVQSFPTNLLAAPMGHVRRPFYGLEDQSQRGMPALNLGPRGSGQT